MAGAPTKPSCDMCAYERSYRRATQDIVYAGEVYSVCDHHAANPIPDPRAEPDFGPAPDNGTETSQEAAKQAQSKVTPQCYTVLGVLATAPEGLTREEIYKRAQITNQAACARLNTLESHGLVVVDGEKRMADTRRLQQVYKLARVA